MLLTDPTLPATLRPRRVPSMKLPFVAACLALVLGADPASADYDKTKWGMSLAEIQKLYPGGKTQEFPEAGTKEYRVVREVGGTPAVITFAVYLKKGADNVKGLNNVFIHFPTDPAAVLATGDDAGIPRRESHALYSALIKRLAAKYGSAELPCEKASNVPPDAECASWTHHGTYIWLASNMDPHHGGVSLQYEKDSPANHIKSNPLQGL
jgi:hypothetical protein